MKQLLASIKNNFALIGYLVLSILLFCACFWSVFAWIAAVYVVLLAFYLRQETKLIGLILFLNCFYIVFNYQNIAGVTLDIILVGILILMIVGQYLYRVIKKTQKLNWKILIPVGLFLLYVALPLHACRWQDFIAMVFFFVLVYVAFEDRQKIDFRYLIRILVAGIIISCTFALFKGVSPLLAEKIDNVTIYGCVRFQGLSFHPNTLTRMLMLAIAGILILKYQNKISLVELMVAFVPMFIFGYLTISRSFLVTILVAIIVFTLFYLVRRKAKALILPTVLLVIMVAVGGVFFNISQIYLERVMEDDAIDSSEVKNINSSIDLTTANLDEFFNNHPAEWIQDVLSGQVRFDPGRTALRELYLRDWSSSAQTIWFGRGISRPLIAQMSAHNLYIQELWKHGIVGYIFYAVIIACSINWKNIKRIKFYLPVLIILTPYLMITMVEQCLLDYIPLVVILSAIGLFAKATEPAIEQIQADLPSKA